MSEPDSNVERSALNGSGHGKRWAAIAVVAVVVVGVVATIVLVTGRDKNPGTPSASPTGAPTTVAPTTTPATTTSPGTPTTTAPATSTSPGTANATRALSGFFTAAATLDAQLHDAASAINGSGPPWTAVTEAVAKKVRAADLVPVGRAIPAGMPRDLVRSVVLVYSDLASRRYAMADFTYATGIDPRAYPTSDDILRNLRNGHAAAARFESDLAAARSLAAATPPFPVRSTGSRQAAEVAVLVQFVGLANGGCDSRGGHVITTPPPIVWQRVPLYPGGPMADGTVAGIRFQAVHQSDGNWRININAC
jgi:hypothetical protein